MRRLLVGVMLILAFFSYFQQVGAQENTITDPAGDINNPDADITKIVFTKSGDALRIDFTIVGKFSRGILYGVAFPFDARCTKGVFVVFQGNATSAVQYDLERGCRITNLIKQQRLRIEGSTAAITMRFVDLGKYKTFAFGVTFDDKDILDVAPDVGFAELIFPAPFTISGLIARSTVLIDDKQFTVDATGAVTTELPLGTHTVHVEPMVDVAVGKRAVFVGWTDGNIQNPRTVNLEDALILRADYKTQFMLTVDSSMGEPQGSAWYDEGTTATFSVRSPVPADGFLGTIGVKHVFDHWSGDSGEETSKASILMNGAKTVRAVWRTDYSSLYIFVAVVVAAVGGAGGFFFLKARRGRVAGLPVGVAPQVSAPPVCVSCGAQLNRADMFCPNCGARQPTSA